MAKEKDGKFDWLKKAKVTQVTQVSLKEISKALSKRDPKRLDKN